MWLLFALLVTTLIAAGAYIVRTRLNWKGDRFTHGQTTYYTHVTRKNRRIVSCNLGVDVPDDLDFSIGRENSFDRFAKGLGLAQEFQIGQADFDQAVYILSDDDRVAALFRHDPRAQGAVGRIFRTDGPGVRFETIRCIGGRLWASFGVDDESALAQLQAQTGELVPCLAHLASGLAKEQIARGSWGVRDLLVKRGALAGAVGLGLLLNALVELIRLQLFHFPRLEHWSAPLPLAIAVTLVVLVAGLGGAFVWLGSSARRHVVMFELAMTVSVGGLGSAYTALRDMNVEMDHSEAELLPTTVLGKRQYRSSKSTHYRVELLDWHGDGGTVELEVDRHTFLDLPSRGPLSVVVHSGRLGWPWIERLESARPSTPTGRTHD